MHDARMGFARRLTLKVKQVGHDTLVLDDDSGQIHQLNQTASFVWNQCDGKTPRSIIAQRLAEAFEVDPADAMRDVSAVIETLCELNLLTR